MSDDKKDGWHTIQIDQDVFEFLQEEARPFVDSPNDVLRRLLLNQVQVNKSKPGVSQYFMDGVLEETDSEEEKELIGNVRSLPNINTRGFVDRILGQRFGSGFSRVGRYVYMFESATDLVYFQNYNKRSDILWYRIDKEDRQILNKSAKKAWLCLTCPSGNLVFILPVNKIEEMAKLSDWKPGKLEIHIQVKACKWAEFDWNIKEFLYEPE